MHADPHHQPANGTNAAPEAQPAAGPVARRDYPLAAWLVILLASGVVMWGQARAADPVPRAQASALVWDLQARLIMGTAWLAGDTAAAERQLRQLVNPASGLDRCRLTALAAELSGNGVALEELAAIDRDFPPSLRSAGEEAAVIDALRQLLLARASGNEPLEVVPQPERALLRARLGWVGRLALVPRDSAYAAERSALQAEARRTALVFTLAFMGVVLGGLTGGGLLVGWCVLLGTGRWTWRHAPSGRHGGIYAETFAVWMLLFLGFSAVVPLLVPQEWHLLGAALASFGSLAALLWPVARGVPFAQLRHDLGLVVPKQAWREPLHAVAAYVAGIPVVAAGAAVTLLLLNLQQRPHLVPLAGLVEPPVHPVLGPLVNSGSWGRAQAVLVVLLVPVAEEIMFRGVLYRHLREATSRWRRGVSIAAAALASGALFAAVHPQGWVAIPPLAAVGAVLALEREWRSSLLAPVITHMLVNGLTVALVLLAAS